MGLLFYSKFSHVFERDDVFAYYHSLRLKPIYVNRKFHELLQKLIELKDVDLILPKLCDKDASDFKSLVDILIDAKIFSKDQSFDEKIIQRFKSHLPKPYVQIAYFVMTEHCNLSCSYCFIENKMDRDAVRTKIMSKGTVKAGLDFFCTQIQRKPEFFEDEKTIIIYGGEPLTNFEGITYLVKLIGEYKAVGKLPQKTNISIITNGTLMTDEIASFLKDNGLSIAVSLDGADAACNSCRKFIDGRPAFDDIINGIRICKKNGCDCGLSITLTEETIKDFQKIQGIVEEFGVDSFGFNLLMTDENFHVSADYNEKASEFILRAFEYFREKGVYEDRIMRKAKSFVDGKIYLYDCGALGGNQIVIAPNGDVGICHGYLHNRDYFVTTVYDSDFDPEQSDVYCEWNMRTPICMEQCQNCVALGICGGGCPANARNNSTSKSLWELDERFCVHAKKTLEWLIWDLYKQTMMSAQENLPA